MKKIEKGTAQTQVPKRNVYNQTTAPENSRSLVIFSDKIICSPALFTRLRQRQSRRSRRPRSLGNRRFGLSFLCIEKTQRQRALWILMCVFLFFFTLYKLYEEVAGNRAIQSGWHTTCWAMKGHLRQHPAYIYVYIYIYICIYCIKILLKQIAHYLPGYKAPSAKSETQVQVSTSTADKKNPPGTMYTKFWTV